MSFCFKQNESVAKAIRRLGRKQSKTACKNLRKLSLEAAAHESRKNIKKARAILRLAKPHLAKKMSRRQLKLLRRAADLLAGLRDARVMIDTLRVLRKSVRGRIAPAALRGLHGDLQHALQCELKKFKKKKTGRRAEKLLRRSVEEWANIKIDCEGWEAIRRGLKNSYDSARQACRTAAADPSPENLHEWRKRTKDLLFNLRLLHPIQPDEFNAMAKELDALGDYLGDDHDLVMLRETAAKLAGPNFRGELKLLDKLIAQRRHELQGEAFLRGGKFFTEKPFVFCERLEDYWRAWRNETQKSLS